MKRSLQVPGRERGEPTSPAVSERAASRALENAERRADEATQQYRALADMLPALIGETDALGRLVFVNRYGLELMGYGDDDWRGLPILEVLAPADRARAAENFGRRMAGEELTPSTYTLVHKDGVTAVPVELRASNIVRDGRVVGARCVLFDLRERLAAERERLRYEQRALSAQRLESLGVLAGGVAHDFNNLLAVVLGNAELALLELPGSSPALPYVRDIRAASQRAAGLTRQLLAYTGKAPFHWSDVDVNALVRQGVREAVVGLPPGQRVELALADTLPFVHGDGELLGQIVTNLLTNGLESLDATGSVVIETRPVEVAPGATSPALVEPDHLPAGAYVRCSVLDDGAGMDAATLSRILEPFFTTKFTGRGLGLSVVLGVVRSHGGGLALSSDLGRGTRVDVYLPASAVPTVSRANSAVAELKGRALVIDTEPSVAEILRRILRRLGLEVATVTDADSAARVAAEGIDVALAASRGGSRDADLIRRFHALSPELPVILYSAEPEEIVRGRLAGERLAGFLDKPFDLQASRALLRSLLAEG